MTEESKKVIKLMLSEKLQISGKVREGRGWERRRKRREGCGREPTAWNFWILGIRKSVNHFLEA